jgi:hypothetical protein
MSTAFLKRSKGEYSDPSLRGKREVALASCPADLGLRELDGEGMGRSSSICSNEGLLADISSSALMLGQDVEGGENVYLSSGDEGSAAAAWYALSELGAWSMDCLTCSHFRTVFSKESSTPHGARLSVPL